jgi:hypothetical protein
VDAFAGGLVLTLEGVQVRKGGAGVRAEARGGNRQGSKGGIAVAEPACAGLSACAGL